VNSFLKMAATTCVAVTLLAGGVLPATAAPSASPTETAAEGAVAPAKSTILGAYALEAEPTTGTHFSPGADGTVSFASRPSRGTDGIGFQPGQSMSWTTTLPAGLEARGNTCSDGYDGYTASCTFGTIAPDGTREVVYTITRDADKPAVTDAFQHVHTITFDVRATADLAADAKVVTTFTPTEGHTSDSPRAETTVPVASSTVVGTYDVEAKPTSGTAFSPGADGTVSFASRPSRGTDGVTFQPGESMSWTTTLPAGLDIRGSRCQEAGYVGYTATCDFGATALDGTREVVYTITRDADRPAVTNAFQHVHTVTGDRVDDLSGAVDLADGAEVSTSFTPTPSHTSAHPTSAADVAVAVGPVVTVTNPADPADGYAPGTAFTFTGTATAGKTITVQNKFGTVLAQNVPVQADGTWSWTRANMGTSNWQLEFVQDKGAPAEEKATVYNFAPNATPAPVVTVTNPANPADGYAPGTAFTFTGTATAGKAITVQNKFGTVLAQNVPVQADGTWTWTRANMGTSNWQLEFIQDKGTANEHKATVYNFKPNATPAPVVTVTNPANPADGYPARTSFTFTGKATPGKTITVQNVFGTVVAQNVPVAADGTWSWTRANMGTSTWQLEFIQDKGAPTEEKATVYNFAPRD
jgi:hypothetical protein